MTDQVLELTGISKYYGARPILDGVSVSINRGERIGLVGENGTGKTTLANIIMGAVEADEGQKRIPHGLEIGYLPQEAVIEEEMSVQMFLERAIGKLDQMRADLAALESQMASGEAGALADILQRYGQLQEEFTRRGGYDIDYRFDQVFAGLDLAHIDRQRSVRTLSGGEKTRVLLAGLLLGSPDLLILDEPTNHLDFSAVDWLEEYLLTYEGAVFIISHDRHFLNKVVMEIIELSPTTHKLTVYHGNYDFYLAERERMRQKEIDAYEAQQEEIKSLQQLIKAKTHSAGSGRPAKDNDKFLVGFKAGRNDNLRSREIANAKRRLEEIAENAVARPVNRWRITPDFDSDALASRDAIRLHGVSKAYGGRCLFEDVTATISAGDRVVLVGPNGIGKTTLVRLILRMESPDSGSVYTAPGARIGYLDQEQETLEPEQTVLEAYRRDLVGPEDEHRASLHKYGLFSEDQVHQKIGSLSIGQRRKLQIARLIGTKANLLILDEPTNHLDLESVERFEHALCEFQGTIFAISHDRYFIDRVATTVWQFRAGQLVVENRRG